VCPIEKRFWERFCDALDLPSEFKSRGNWSTGTDFGEDYAGERQQIAERLLLKTGDEWISLLRRAEVPIAPVLDWREAMKSEHAAANGAMAEYDYNGEKVRVPTTPVSITSAAELKAKDNAALADAHRSKANDVSRAPYLGEHNQAVFKELGIEP
jgi:crotonobetainyl-CoA:carnitine CoA-transferase CaiB-like acyl-CoA transferase